MDNPEIEEDPVLHEIREIRAEIHEMTKNMSSAELSRWYTEQANAVKEQYYGEKSSIN
jgi:hypothetical protein